MAKTLLLIATGGTISSAPADKGLIPQLQAADFAAELTLPSGWILETLDMGHALSSNFTLDTIAHISHIVANCTADAVVVLHGTGVMEETAFLTELRVAAQSDHKTVVFTGAQRAPSHRGSDSWQNLSDAVLLATQPNSWRLGVVIVFDGYAFSATHAVKQDSWSLHAFSAKEAGALARIAPTQVQWINWPAWRYACRGTDLDPAVHLLWFVAGMDAPASLPSDLRGLVVAASGIGNVNAAITASIAGLRAQHIPVLVATRTGSGPVFPFYGGGGGSTTLREMGVQFTNLHPLKARLLIMAALKSSDPWSEILTGHPWGPDEA